ncbi:ABC transporter ATP-binding protein [Conexibacter woesei]|uniref:Oligopeptide/dipeptide ABC transporter, ATPase subunit n=1 Tax=Conexibacter woesei (strain DSM 14684 / CCUG 47730 / CIP 108061 / JCM 11494 / NBRC 100937 / ID131577) TaxID=469383 RepID=D3FDA2_CONWI|nr:ABC transporter ATP-binding protein [Conexibacter woesei]ADB53494.1 oligopeptide/dipeptide ABC transporter, ATPase subunit [Conexibacter woesei DSM 14684]
MTPLLDVSGLTIGFPTSTGHALAADGVGFGVDAGETLGLVGESGCGKSVSLRSLLGVIPRPGRVLGGTAMWRGERDLLDASRGDWRAVRGREIAMIFQDPQQSLNPVYSIGDQLVEVLTKRAGRTRRDARARAVELLDRVGIPSARERLRDYPHQLSGGMRQRVMIAIAIACEPALLLADEPTTALDVTIQDQILSLLADLQAESGMALILVSHDLGVIGQACDRVSVMYAGRVVESGDVDEVLLAPRHPYTRGLLAAVPAMPGEQRSERIAAIPGQPPTIADLPPGCSFAPRCGLARAECALVPMELDRRAGAHRSACPFADAARRQEERSHA